MVKKYCQNFHKIIGEKLSPYCDSSLAVGRHARTRKAVAIRSMDKDKIQGRGIINLDKINDLKLSIRHPQILKLYDVLTTQTQVFIIRDIADTDLEKRLFLSPEGLILDEARHFIQQIISGVDFCHRHDIIHRNLKPSKILLHGQNNVKIADFGISRCLKTKGTPPFCAPEIQDELSSGTPLDIWSCGVILHYMLFGEFHLGADLKEIRQKALSKTDLPIQMANSIEDPVSLMLTIDPARRATIDDIKRNEWFNSNLPEGFFLSPSDDAFCVKAEVVQAVLEALKIDGHLEHHTSYFRWTKG